MNLPATTSSAEGLQKKLYFFVEHLQEMARNLPPSYQMRIPYELLSSLANCLLNDMIFDIVIGLMEIQQVTEKHLFQQRLQVQNSHKLEIQRILCEGLSKEQSDRKIQIAKRRHKEEIKSVDKSLLGQLDQKVTDQQETLEKAGVPGFYITPNPAEIKVQMHLLDFILRLSKIRHRIK